MTVGHVSRTHSILPFETAGMKKKTKKKNESGSFWKKISKGSDLKFFLQIRSEKKNSKQCNKATIVGQEVQIKKVRWFIMKKIRIL